MHVAVVGAGVSGLSCAIRLVERGHQVTIHAERRTPHTTSDRSAAAFTPFRGHGGERLRQWTRLSFDDFVALARRNDPASGIRMAWMTELFFEPLDELPWWSDLVGGVQRVDPLPARFAAGLRTRLPAMDMTLYMPWLEQRVADLGGTFVAKHIADLRAPFLLGAHAVVNASGLGARELSADARLRPMRGQVLHVPNDLGLDDCIADSGEGALSTYIFPFARHIVLGGTYEADQPEPVTRESDLDAILNRCRQLLRETGHARWSELGRTRLKAWAGLRPARILGDDDAAIRLELELLDGRFPVIHDYGHGRMGVTLSWGCADEVANLVDTLR